MKKSEIQSILHTQKKYFQTGKTLPTDFRIHALDRLRITICRHKPDIAAALYQDLGKSASEAYMCETGMVLEELSYMRKHLASFARTKYVWTPLAQFPSVSFQKPSPYGTVLIMSPWNYPFLLTMGPLVNALAAGNTAILKPSAYSPHTGKLICRIIAECFPPHYVAVITGGRAENESLLQEHFDYIFFTGSQNVGKEVMKQAASHLTPVTLELGGKSPCIVTKNANLKLAARRIVFGKFINCGQTCVAPDYIYCEESIREKLILELRQELQKQYGRFPLANQDYGRIINGKHFHRICHLIDPDKVIFGGHTDAQSLRIEPTILDYVTFEDAVMQEEIFGPLLPILTYDSLDHAIQKLQSMPHPLALYIFTEDAAEAKKATTLCGFGGGCINDTVIHLSTSQMGFGGFGESGMGSYHGKEGFSTFTHYKSIVDKKTWLDLPMRYQPYRKWKDLLVRLFLH